MSMARKIEGGGYQIGIYEVVRRTPRGKWAAHAVGPGTIGNGYVGDFQSLSAAYLALTGEPLRQPKDSSQ